MTSVDFQSNLRKQIRKLPKFLKFVKIIQFYSILFNRVLSHTEAQLDVEAIHEGEEGVLMKGGVATNEPGGQHVDLGCKRGFELNLKFKLL